MAPKKETAVATTENALETQRSNAMAVSDLAKAGDTRGTENITQEDKRLPFLAIAQKTSKALDRTEGDYIPDLEFGQMYNSETREVYGEGPLVFIPIVSRKRAHLLTESGLNGEEIAFDDPRTVYDESREKPLARKIYDWVVILVPTFEMVIVSFYGKSFGAGKSLNGFVDIRKPSFAGRYTLTTSIGKNEKGSFGKFRVAPAGKPTNDEYLFAEQAFEAMKNANIVAAKEPTENESGDTSFDTQDM